MILYEQGKSYWEVARRYHMHRDVPMMRPTAIRDMQKLLGTTGSKAVDKRLRAFISRHSTPPKTPPPEGPRYA